MLVKTQNYQISVYRCKMLVKTQNYVISVLTHLCSLKRKLPTLCKKGKGKGILWPNRQRLPSYMGRRCESRRLADRRDRTRHLSLRKRCTNHCTTGRVFHWYVSVFPVLAKILKYVILNPLPACVGMVLVARAYLKQSTQKNKSINKKTHSLRYIDTDFRWADSRGIRYNRFYVIANYVISVVTCIHFKRSSAGPRRGLRNNRELRYIGLRYIDSWLYGKYREEHEKSHTFFGKSLSL